MGKGKIKLFQRGQQKPKKADPQPNEEVVIGCTVYNEEDRLPGFLHDHRFVPHIIIIDQSSTDKTGDIARCTKNVSYHRVARFERLGEASFNVLQQLCPHNAWMLLLGVDERVSEDHYRMMRARAHDGRVKYGFMAYWLHRKNEVDGKDVNHLFRTDYDLEGKDWQMRLTYGYRVHYQNVPHMHPEPMAAWAYMQEDVYLTHCKTLAEELDSIRKRSGSVNGTAHRDVAYLEGLKKVFGEGAVKL